MLLASFTYSPFLYFTNIFKIFSILHHLGIGHPPPQELAVSMEGDEVLHNELCVTWLVRSLDPDQ